MKRNAGGTGRSEKQKRSKSYHCSKDRVGGSSPFLLQPNMNGILVMCTRAREARAKKEALDLFNQYADQLYPETATTQNDENESNDDDDLEASIAKELEGLKDTKKEKKERFTSISTGTDCLLFIKTCPEIEPCRFVHDLLMDMKAKQIKKTRYLSRILPVQQTCMANLPEMERVAQAVVHPQFNTPNEQGTITQKTFSVIPRLRNNSKLDRMSVIKMFAASVGPDHKVDLDDPDFVILVDVTRTICSMAVVKDFGTLRKYNLESLLGLNDGDAKAQIKTSETSAPPTEDEPVETKKDNEPAEIKKDDEEN